MAGMRGRGVALYCKASIIGIGHVLKCKSVYFLNKSKQVKETYCKHTVREVCIILCSVVLSYIVRVIVKNMWKYSMYYLHRKYVNLFDQIQWGYITYKFMNTALMI